MPYTLRLRFRTLTIYLVLAILMITMLITISQYRNFNDNVGFLKYKQDYVGNRIWISAFYIHVFSCFVCLLAGFTQFSSFVLKETKNLHRIFGRVYAFNILLINFPAGLILASCANGYVPAKIAFFTLDILWFAFTLKGVSCIKKGNIEKHRDFMFRSYALTLSALTLRVWKLVLTNFTDFNYESIYMIVSWIGFVPNLLLAEWIIQRRKRKLSLKPEIA